MKLFVIGLGYVGRALALRAKQENISLACSYCSLETKAYAESLGLKAYPIEKSFAQLDCFDAILIASAPKRGASYKEAYLELAKKVINSSTKAHIIYLSSSSVYGNHEGNCVTEQSPLLNNSPNGKILIETEDLYRQMPSHTILRLGQIIGPGRELEDFIVRIGTKVFGDGVSYTNLSHLDDIVEAILFTLKNNLYGTYNLCWDFHPTRKELYQSFIKEISFSKEPSRSGNRKVSSAAICKLGFVFSKVPFNLE